ADESFPAIFPGVSSDAKVLIVYIDGREVILQNYSFGLPFREYFSCALCRVRRLGRREMDAVVWIVVQRAALLCRYDIKERSGKLVRVDEKIRMISPGADRKNFCHLQCRLGAAACYTRRP